jgi:hypothetical protein
MTQTTRKHRRTLPVTPVDEFPITEETKAKLLRSLAEAEEDIKAGNATEYDPKAFRDSSSAFAAGRHDNYRLHFGYLTLPIQEL